MLAHFKPFSEDVINHHEGDTESAVAALLALVAGFPRPIPGRSLLSGVPGYRTVMVAGRDAIQSRGYAVGVITRDMHEQKDSALNLKDVRVPPLPSIYIIHISILSFLPIQL